MCKTCDKVEAVLEEIDKNPYTFILEEGYKGKRCHSASCPIATALSVALDGMKVSAEPENARVYLPTDHTPCENHLRPDVLLFPLPDNIKTFIYKFDMNYYPNLVSEMSDIVYV